MHQSMMDALPDYLDFLEEIKADYITVGDAGVSTSVTVINVPSK